MNDPFQKLKITSLPFIIFTTSHFKKKKFWLAVAGIFLLSLVVGGFYRVSQRNKFLSLVPIDTVLYLEFKEPSRWQFFPWLIGQNKQLAALPFDNFYRQVDNIFNWPAGSFKNEILTKSSRLVFFLMPDLEGKKLDWTFILVTKENSVKQKIRQLPHYLAIKKNIIAFSDSAGAIGKLKAVNQKIIFPLYLKAEAKKLTADFGRGYLDADNLKQYLEQQNLATKIFKNNFSGIFYFTLTPGRESWQFNFSGGQTNRLAAGTKPLLDYLPGNFLVFISGFNFFDIFSVWGQTDAELKRAFEQTAATINAVYELDFGSELADLFNQSADLIILPPAEKNIWGGDFLLALPKTLITSPEQLEKLVNIILAQKKPVEVSRILPDGSRVTEVAANPESFIWQSQDFEEGLTIKYLTEPQLNFEIAYVIFADSIFFSSSVDLLKGFINKPGIFLTPLFNICPGIEAADQFIILPAGNRQSVTNSLFQYLPSGKMIIKKGGDGSLVGCLFSF